MDENSIRAVMDIGSHSVRMLLDGEGMHRLYSTITRLGEGAGAGVLQAQAMQRTIDVVEEFHKIARRYGAEPVLFATSAVRDAENRQQFEMAIMDACQLPLRTLSGEEEAELALAGATMDLPDIPLGVVDIGGGSTEIVCGVNCNMRIASSFPVGAVRLTDRQLPVEEMISTAQESIRTAPKSPVYKRWRGIGGTISALAAMDMQLQVFDGKKVHGYRLHFDAVREWIERLAAMTPLERTRIPSLQPQRGKVILAGACVLLGAMRALSVPVIEACTLDNLQGALRLLDAWHR